MPLYPKWRRILIESERQALVAIDFYNRPGERRSVHDFIVHMHLAWLYLLQAEFEMEGRRYVYLEKVTGLVVMVNDEPKAWSLEDSLRAKYPSTENPVRSNIEFFIGLRNKIEHRYQHELGNLTSGEAQALVINYERERVSYFGENFSMATVLRFPIFLQALTPSGVSRMRESARRLRPPEVVLG